MCMGHAYHSFVDLWWVAKDNWIGLAFEKGNWTKNIDLLLLCLMANFSLFCTFKFYWCVRRIRWIMMSSWQSWKVTWVPTSHRVWWELSGSLKSRVALGWWKKPTEADETTGRWADRILWGSSVLQWNRAVRGDEQVAGGVMGMDVKIGNLSAYRWSLRHGAKWDPLSWLFFEGATVSKNVLGASYFITHSWMIQSCFSYAMAELTEWRHSGIDSQLLIQRVCNAVEDNINSPGLNAMAVSI